eukprot:COSAG01_NODE_494_length_16322_cov_35.380879_19_plen_350_part_00
MPLASRNYYERLEVEPDAEVEAMKKAYRKLSRRYHPDKGGSEVQKAGPCVESTKLPAMCLPTAGWPDEGTPCDGVTPRQLGDMQPVVVPRRSHLCDAAGAGGVAQADFQALGEAHECLKDPFQRSMYDSWLKGDQSEPFNPSGFPDLSELWPEGSWTQPLVLVRRPLVLAEGGGTAARARTGCSPTDRGRPLPCCGSSAVGSGGGLGGEGVQRRRLRLGAASVRTAAADIGAAAQGKRVLLLLLLLLMLGGAALYGVALDWCALFKNKMLKPPRARDRGATRVSCFGAVYSDLCARWAGGSGWGRSAPSTRRSALPCTWSIRRRARARVAVAQNVLPPKIPTLPPPLGC